MTRGNSDRHPSRGRLSARSLDQFEIFGDRAASCSSLRRQRRTFLKRSRSTSPAIRGSQSRYGKVYEGLSNGRLNRKPSHRRIEDLGRPDKKSAAQSVISFNQNMRLPRSFDKNFSCNIGGNAAVYGLSASSQRRPMFLTSGIPPVASKQICRLLRVQEIANVSANAGGD